jgi:hypothetical protein
MLPSSMHSQRARASIVRLITINLCSIVCVWKRANSALDNDDQINQQNPWLPDG